MTAGSKEVMLPRDTDPRFQAMEGFLTKEWNWTSQVEGHLWAVETFEFLDKNGFFWSLVQEPEGMKLNLFKSGELTGKEPLLTLAVKNNGKLAIQSGEMTFYSTGNLSLCYRGWSQKAPDSKFLVLGTTEFEVLTLAKTEDRFGLEINPRRK